MGKSKSVSRDLDENGSGTCFDYSALDTQTARAIRVSTKRIRFLVKRSLDDVIAIGEELTVVKGALPHGQFLSWLKSEFGWQERSARNFISVANRFESATVADLDIDLSAAYLLAAPSAPESARTNAVKRASEGERVSRSIAKEIISEANGGKVPVNPNSKKRSACDETLTILHELKGNWPKSRVSEFAQLLRQFADSLDTS